MSAEKYKIIQAGDYDTLCKKVNLLMDGGYVPHGGLVIRTKLVQSTVPNSYRIKEIEVPSFYQALILK